MLPGGRAEERARHDGCFETPYKRTQRRFFLAAYNCCGARNLRGDSIPWYAWIGCGFGDGLFERTPARLSAAPSARETAVAAFPGHNGATAPLPMAGKDFNARQRSENPLRMALPAIIPYGPPAQIPPHAFFHGGASAPFSGRPPAFPAISRNSGPQIREWRQARYEFSSSSTRRASR